MADAETEEEEEEQEEGEGDTGIYEMRIKMRVAGRCDL